MLRKNTDEEGMPVCVLVCVDYSVCARVCVCMAMCALVHVCTCVCMYVCMWCALVCVCTVCVVCMHVGMQNYKYCQSNKLTFLAGLPKAYAYLRLVFLLQRNIKQRQMT